MKKNLPLGPVMADLKGLSLDDGEREMLQHPALGGVVLFARNFESPRQLKELTSAIREQRTPEVLIAVDHEGGRVQRFQSGFTRIPPMAILGRMQAQGGPSEAVARAIGVIIATELLSHGVDFSFTPVLDLDYGASSIIGDRAFAAAPETVTQLAGCLIEGLRSAGMAAVGKHFPGHGYVFADSHLAIPVDERPAESLAGDLAPYRALATGQLGGIMPAHVIFPAVDARPAGFSTRWLREIMRGEIGFKGMIFSDDLSMEGASFAGDMQQRADAAVEAGCDMVLVCNAAQSALQVLDHLRDHRLDAGRAEGMRGKFNAGNDAGYADAKILLQRHCPQ